MLKTSGSGHKNPIFEETHETTKQKTVNSLLFSKDLLELLTSTLGLGSLSRLLADLVLGVLGGVRVEAEKDLLVAERVLLLDEGTLGAGLTLGLTEYGLDFRRVDDTGNVGVGKDVGGEEEVLLKSRSSSCSTVNLVQSSKSSRGPDNEATKVATGGELEEVEGVDGGGLNTGDVAEGLDELLAVGIGVVDNERTTALAETTTTHLTLTGTGLLGLLDLDEVRAGTDSLEEGNGGLGLGDSGVLEGLGLNDEGDFGDAGDTVTAGEQKRRNGRSSQGRGGSEASVTNVSTPNSFRSVNAALPLTLVDLLVPLAPDLGRSEHTTRTAHVTESSLTSTVSTTTRDTGNTGNSATCSSKKNPINFNPLNV